MKEVVKRCLGLLAYVCVAAYAGTVWAQTPQADVVAAPRFDIERFDVTGNTLLKQGEIDAAVAAYVAEGFPIFGAPGAPSRSTVTAATASSVCCPSRHHPRRGPPARNRTEDRRGRDRRQQVFQRHDRAQQSPGVEARTTPTPEAGKIFSCWPSTGQADDRAVAGETESLVDATVKVIDENPLKFVATLDNPAPRHGPLPHRHRHAALERV
jgi:hypothetical protein